MRIEECHSKKIDRWIAKRHYLKSIPGGARLRLWFYDDNNNVIGAMMWGRPSARLLDQKIILELTRMYFIDNTEHCIESKALAKARKYIRQNFPEVKGLLAYSSTKQGHGGTIYRADNWFPFGITRGDKWSRKNRQRKDIDTSPKIRWLRSP